MDMRRWRPKVGDRVLALGFADLDVDRHLEGEERAIEQYLYGSEAEIIEAQPAGGQSSRPWPVFRVEANWPGGMSGGPVFNQEGNVIGLVRHWCSRSGD
jgi:serine protease Do